MTARAHHLCAEALAVCPVGNIPIQTVYELLLKMVGREDIVAAMRVDGDIAHEETNLWSQ